MELTKNEEDYLKALFQITIETENQKAGTNKLAEYLGLSPASVSNMVKKLKEKGLVEYERYGKLELSPSGSQIAIKLIRKHRLWETFLYKYMNFSWDEVHEVAEQLEHIRSPKLIQELDRFLGYPSKDPHGEVIPDADGGFNILPKKTLAEQLKGNKCRLVSVRDNSAAFLKYVSQIGLALSSDIEILEIRDFDNSLLISFNGQQESVSKHFAEHIFVVEI